MGPHTPGVIARALLMVMMVTTPALLVPYTDPDTIQMVMVLALVGGILTFTGSGLLRRNSDRSTSLAAEPEDAAAGHELVLVHQRTAPTQRELGIN